MDVIHRAFKGPGGFDANGTTEPLVHVGLVTRKDDHIGGFATFSVNSELNDALKGFLFPRNEKTSSHFSGI